MSAKGWVGVLNSEARNNEDKEPADSDAKKGLSGVLDLEASNNEDEEPEVPNIKAPRNISQKLYDTVFSEGIELKG